MSDEQGRQRSDTSQARRPTRDETGLALAHVWAKRGTCARRQVGCVLFDIDGYQLSAGYNGPPSGELHCIDHPCDGAAFRSGFGLDECEAIHAEVGAVARCADIRRVHTCYVTVSPCVSCVKILATTGALRIVFSEEYPQPEAKFRWLRRGADLTPNPYEWVQIPHLLPTEKIERSDLETATMNRPMRGDPA